MNEAIKFNKFAKICSMKSIVWAREIYWIRNFSDVYLIKVSVQCVFTSCNLLYIIVELVYFVHFHWKSVWQTKKGIEIKHLKSFLVWHTHSRQLLLNTTSTKNPFFSKREKVNFLDSGTKRFGMPFNKDQGGLSNGPFFYTNLFGLCRFAQNVEMKEIKHKILIRQLPFKWVD